jgi:hemerythrin
MHAMPTPGAFWLEVYTVGNETIDAQHKQIFGLIKVLETAGTSGDGARTADLVFRYLSRVLANHFVDEERFMAETAYPNLEQHRQQHEACSRRLSELLATVESTSIPTDSYVGFIRQWFHEHLVGSDQDFALWLQKSDEGKSSHQTEQNPAHEEVCA